MNLNAKQFPQTYYAKHMAAGLVGYENSLVHVDTDAIKRMIPTFEGKPIYVLHQEVDLENIKQQADGYVTESFYNEADGCAWVKMLVVDDKALDAIKNGWAVSNAYIPTSVNESGGEYHNIKFDSKMNDGKFTHLAIVPNPRYEEAKIFTVDEFNEYQNAERKKHKARLNSKPAPKGTTMFKAFKMKKEETNELDADTLIEIKNDKGEIETVRLGDMTDTFKAEKEAKNAKTVDENQTVEIDGEKVKISDLAKTYLNAKKKKNADETEESEEETEEEMENESEDEDDKKDDEKKNSKAGTKTTVKKKKAEVQNDDDDDGHFEELQNAHNKGGKGIVAIETSQDQLARGSSRYGSAN